MRVGEKKVMRNMQTLSGAFDEMFKTPSMFENANSSEKFSFKEYLNQKAIRYFPAINVIFVLIYFILTTNNTSKHET